MYHLDVRSRATHLFVISLAEVGDEVAKQVMFLTSMEKGLLTQYGSFATALYCCTTTTRSSSSSNDCVVSGIEFGSDANSCVRYFFRATLMLLDHDMMTWIVTRAVRPSHVHLAARQIPRWYSAWGRTRGRAWGFAVSRSWRIAPLWGKTLIG